MTIYKKSPFNFAEAVLDKIVLRNNQLFVYVYNIQTIEEIQVNVLSIPKYSFLSHCLLIYSLQSLTYSYEESRKIPKENRECIGDTFKENRGKSQEFWLAFEKIEIILEKNTNVSSKSFSDAEINSFSFENL